MEFWQISSDSAGFAVCYSNCYTLYVLFNHWRPSWPDAAAGNGLSGPAIAGIAAGIPCSLLFLLLLGLLIYFAINYRKKKRLCLVLFFSVSCVLLDRNRQNAATNGLLMFCVSVFQDSKPDIQCREQLRRLNQQHIDFFFFIYLFSASRKE